MPRVAIDPVTRTIRVDDRVWPFEWEPAAATAAVVLDGRRFELQTMTWRQKCNLARAARKIGPSEEALGAALANACLPPRTPLPDRADERAALVDLARWLVSDEDLVPWEPVMLARITVEVCRATQLTPQALDTLPAAEVEAMWSVARPENRATEAAPLDGPARAGVTRIVVLPDPATDAARDLAASSPEPRVDPALQVRNTAPASTAAAPPAVDDAMASDVVNGALRAIVPPSASSPIPVSASRYVTRADAVVSRHEARMNRAMPQRIRVSRVTARIGSAAPPTDRRERSRQTESTSLDPLGARAALEPIKPAANGEPSVLPSWRGDREPASPIETSRPSSGSVRTPLDDAPGLPAAPAHDPFISDADPFGDHDAPATRAGADPFALFDDFERAAVEAGIDLEG